MARFDVPYLVERTTSTGGVRRYWNPRKKLRALGWPTVRLSDDFGDAIRQARAINAVCDRWSAQRGSRQQVARPADLVDRLRVDWGETLPDVTPTPGAPSVPPAAGPGTVGAMIDAFYLSPQFTAKMPKTQGFYRYHLETVRQWAGDLPVQSITAPAVDEFREALAKRAPRKATGVVQAIRRLYNWGARQHRFRALIAENPGARAQLDMSPASEPRLWQPDEARHMVATADRLGHHAIGTAIMLAIWLGQRQGDILALRRDAWADGWFTLIQSKTGRAVTVPDNPSLSQRIEAEFARQNAAGIGGVTILLDEVTGRPYDEDLFRKRFRKVRNAAARDMASCGELQFYHCRHTAVCAMAEAECTTIEIAAISGHSLQHVATILERYLVRTRALAANAVAKRLQHEGA